MPALCDLCLTEAVGAIRRGEIKAEALVEALLARQAANEHLNIFTFLDPAATRAAARAADVARARGEALGPLHGAPIALKDNIATIEGPTTAGTPALRDHRPIANAPVAEALIRAGAILFGKVGMHELAFGVTSNNAAFGAVRNPYDPQRSPGGSSGGSGAVVGARIAPASLGSDTGGSVRIPANFCGAAGFRPTTGRWPQQRIVPISATRDTAGPIARRVGDLALLDRVVTGADAVTRPSGLKGARIGLPRALFWEGLDAQIAGIAEEAAAALRGAGATLIDIDLSALATAEGDLGFVIAFYEFERDLAAYLREHAPDISFQDVIGVIASPDVKALLEPFAGASGIVSPAAYHEAIAIDRPRLIATYARAFAEHGLDAIVYPTSPLQPPPIGEDATTMLNGVAVPTFQTIARNVGPGSIAGLPSLSIPIALSASGLPVGVTCDALPGQDAALLALSAAVEALFPELPPPALRDQAGI